MLGGLAQKGAQIATRVDILLGRVLAAGGRLDASMLECMARRMLTKATSYMHPNRSQV